MRNENADLIHRFWRWEYLRRNPYYIERYQDLARAFQSTGVDGFPFRKDGKAGTFDILTFDFDTFFESLPKRPGFQFLILSEWEAFSERFNIRFPIHYHTGPDSKTVLLAHIEAEEKDNPVDYSKLVSGTVVYDRLPFSVRDPEDYELSPEGRWVLNKLFKARFAKDLPDIKDIDLGMDEPALIRHGNHLFAAGTPEALMTKEARIITARKRLLKSRNRKNADRMATAIRNRDREQLRINQKRMKTNNLLRAAGLYLWDQKQEAGALSLDMIKNFYADFPDLPDRYQLDDLGHELRKIVKKTGLCIKHMGLLPMR